MEIGGDRMKTPVGKTPPIEETDEEVEREPAEISALGIRHAAPGFQPVTDLASFMAKLPDFGEDGKALHEAIMEDRKLRRAAIKDDDDC
jgi:hypothetical protein